jgi:hypothetical protein
MNPGRLLRLEGVAVFAAALGAYFAIDGRLWLLLVLALAPDLAMLGYLAGSRVGSHLYNALHTYVAPLAIAGVGVLVATPLLASVALVWAAHIGADRALGYGLKYPSAFGDTHLGSKRATEASTTTPADPASGR